ncbi:MAG UNVERIFIED_CONTAM: hypothetical protein LVT10_07385 [Anaerolineae bacterium]
MRGAVSAFGKFLTTQDNEVVPGFDWLKNALLVATHPILSEFEKDMRAILRCRAIHHALEIGDGFRHCFCPQRGI